MNSYIKIVTLVMSISFFSCTDKRKEEEKTKAAIEKIETIENELDQISEEIDTKSKELEDSLKELDSI